jgi:hypothetical protein
MIPVKPPRRQGRQQIFGLSHLPAATSKGAGKVVLKKKYFAAWRLGDLRA